MFLSQVYESPEASPLLAESAESQFELNQEKNCQKFYQDVYHQNKTIPHSKMVNFKEESNLVLYDEDEEVLEDGEEFDDYGDAVSEYLDELEHTYSLNKDLACPWSREPLKLVNSLDLDEYRYR